MAAQSSATLGAVEKISVHGRSLEGNLDGDSPDRTVFVYLPPSYKTDPNRRYPVVYLLHGYGLQAERWMTFARIEKGANQSMTGAGTGERAREMILVNPDAYTIYDGSMYSSSVAIGDWETFLAEDLIAYIDGHYRTIPNRASRGLAGHSMGGYGTLRLGMKRSDVFSSLYPMSACCSLEGGEPSEALAAAEALKTRKPSPRCVIRTSQRWRGGGMVAESEEPAVFRRPAGQGRRSATGDTGQVAGQLHAGDDRPVHGEPQTPQGDSVRRRHRRQPARREPAARRASHPGGRPAPVRDLRRRSQQQGLRAD